MKINDITWIGFTLAWIAVNDFIYEDNDKSVISFHDFKV